MYEHKQKKNKNKNCWQNMILINFNFIIAITN